MYNEDIKLQYLLETAPTKDGERLAKKLFNDVEAGETELGKDIGEMELEQWITLVQSFNLTSYRSVLRIVNILRDYLRWYSFNVSPVNADSLSNFTAQSIDIKAAVQKLYVFDIKELIAASESHPAREGYIEQAVICLSWMGMDNKKIITTRNEDVLFGDASVSVASPPKKYDSFDSDVIRVLSDYIGSKDAVLDRKRWLSSQTCEQVDLGFFIKRVAPKDVEWKDKPIDSRELAIKLSIFKEFQDHFDINMGCDRILKAGRLRRLYDGERNGIPVTDERVKSVFEIESYRYEDTLKTYRVYKEIMDEIR